MLLAPGSGSKKDGDGSHNNADANSNHTPTDTNTDTHKESSKKTPHTVVPADSNKPKPNEGEAHENGNSSNSSKPEWLIKLEGGRAFDDVQSVNYTYNQIYVKKSDGDGYFILDSYKPGEEIVSRKNTQLSEIQKSTANGYINEINNKYLEGAEIADVASNNAGGKNDGIFENGNILEGESTLEVPVQDNPVPQSVIDAANNADVTIRDVNGTIYNP